jgi:hypothetical protein
VGGQHPGAQSGVLDGQRQVGLDDGLVEPVGGDEQGVGHVIRREHVGQRSRLERHDRRRDVGAALEALDAPVVVQTWLEVVRQGPGPVQEDGALLPGGDHPGRDLLFHPELAPGVLVAGGDPADVLAGLVEHQRLDARGREVAEAGRLASR